MSSFLPSFSCTLLYSFLSSFLPSFLRLLPVFLPSFSCSFLQFLPSVTSCLPSLLSFSYVPQLLPSLTSFSYFLPSVTSFLQLLPSVTAFGYFLPSLPSFLPSFLSDHFHSFKASFGFIFISLAAMGVAIEQDAYVPSFLSSFLCFLSFPSFLPSENPNQKVSSTFLPSIIPLFLYFLSSVSFLHIV
jgi:hypothetical protein